MDNFVVKVRIGWAHFRISIWVLKSTGFLETTILRKVLLL